MYGINYQLIVCRLVVLMCLNSNRIDTYLIKAGYT